MTDKEIKRRTINEEFMAISAVHLLFRALAEVVRMHVTDEDIITKITEQWLVINRGVGQGLLSPGETEDAVIDG